MLETLKSISLPREITAKLTPDTQDVLSRYPGVLENLVAHYDREPLPANTDIDSFEIFCNEIQCYAEVDGQTTLAIQAVDSPQIDVIEIAINGELALIKVGMQIILNRIDLIASTSNSFRNKLLRLPA
jgi:hypothetical protein